MNYQETYSLLIRYIDGETSVEETAVMEELLSTDVSWKNEYEILTLLNGKINTTFHSGVDAGTSENWEALKSRINMPVPQKATVMFWPSVVKYAAAAAVVLLAGWYFLKPANTEFGGFDIGLTYKTGNHQTKIVRLNDGTQIVLNENSVITLDKDFNENERLVELDGEAYFEVTGNSSKPFIAKTKNTFTKVLGTSFKINSKSDNNIAISLYRGKVQFNTGNETKIIEPGEKLDYSTSNHSIRVQRLDNLVKETWAITGLSFKDARLADIVKKLGAAHSISISIPSTRQNEEFTVSFDGLNLSASLRILEELTDSKIIKKDSNYILIP